MSVQLWKVLLPALGLSLIWTACKKEQSATQTEQQSQDPMYSGVVADDATMVNKTPLILSADFLTTVHTARKGKPGTTPVDTTTTTTPTTPDTTTTTTPPATPADTTVITTTPLPASYALNMPPVRSQGTEGSCVAFAVAYYARACEQYYKTGATSYSDASNAFSPEYVFNQVKIDASCSGSAVVTSLELLKSQGVCTWQSMPYSPYGCATLPTTAQKTEAANFKIASYSKIINADQTAIKTMISSKHPVIASFTIDPSFYSATSGFIWKSLTGNSGSHTMALCGYDDAKHAYKAVNSWGTTWGDAGYIWIDYDFFTVTSSYYTYVVTL
jgi:C1A family cysteine protease